MQQKQGGPKDKKRKEEMVIFFNPFCSLHSFASKYCLSPCFLAAGGSENKSRSIGRRMDHGGAIFFFYFPPSPSFNSSSFSSSSSSLSPAWTRRKKCGASKMRITRELRPFFLFSSSSSATAEGRSLAEVQ